MIVTTSLGSLVVNLGSLSKIPQGEGRTFRIGEQAVAVFHTRDGNVFVTEPTCPHKGGPLADGLVGAQKVICPLHSYVFDLCDGRASGNGCPPLKTYPVMVNDEGHILVAIDDLMAVR